MVTEFRFGLTERSTKGIGLIIKHMDKANSGMQMEMSLTVGGQKIKLMDTEYIHM